MWRPFAHSDRKKIDIRKNIRARLDILGVLLSHHVQVVPLPINVAHHHAHRLPDRQLRPRERSGERGALGGGERDELWEVEAAAEGVESALQVRGEPNPNALRVDFHDIPAGTDANAGHRVLGAPARCHVPKRENAASTAQSGGSPA